MTLSLKWHKNANNSRQYHSFGQQGLVSAIMTNTCVGL